ncbi:Glycyl-tRNA synthetase [Naegleria gruberi]|uniref:Glycine--tRNA ligase n=1 Tax=Naegleria gruberi TaxID=5762 RepID=D2VK04_NAEGR|nr:Glycyl-tRNA synthetase [Naegleria gruberi]EFC42863.1 Glycyl-tRNA synthetase [Naegleria gruberi]|eukprot:XP_002675607.1 Glycyl-tRNA synthetase [Naegleria gruberi strain NEG-M]
MKKEINQITKEWNRANPDKLHINPEEFNELLTRRFFVIPSFEIYGGVAGLYDYGPPACAIKANILDLWRRHFVNEENMLEVDCSSLTPETVFVASGHVQRFADWMVKDVVTNDCFRADKLVGEFIDTELEENSELTQEKTEEYALVKKKIDDYDGKGLDELIQKYGIKSPTTGNELSASYPFNLMFSTPIGPTGKLKGYLRPETAQGIFVNFKRLLEYNGKQMPFASAQIGQAFRNEISPRSGLLRVREFTLAEIEHFLNPDVDEHPKLDTISSIRVPFFSRENQTQGLNPVDLTIAEAMEKGWLTNKTHAYYIARVKLFMDECGVLPTAIRFRQHLANEMAHYARDCWDCELLTSYGWIEVVGIANRSCFDLENHSKYSKNELVAYESFETPTVEEFVAVEPVKQKIGKILKGDVEPVMTYLNSLTDQERLDLQKQLDETGKISFRVESIDKTIELTKDLIAFPKREKKILGRNYTPGVIEPSFGIGRIIYCLLEHSYWVRPKQEHEKEEDKIQRAVLSLPPAIAPYKVALLPIKADQDQIVKKLQQSLARYGISHRVDAGNQNIGKKYARADDIGIPFAITIDDNSVTAGTVTIRERDSCEQVIVPISDLITVLNDLIDRIKLWEDIKQAYPEQKQTASDKVGKKQVK